MRWAKQILRNQFYVTDVADGTVWLVLGDGEYDMELPVGKYIRMFGRDRLRYGCIGTIVLKQRADGKTKLRGWPYKRKWTEEEIAEAKRRGDELADALLFD
jgi:hypothetical protein